MVFFDKFQLESEIYWSSEIVSPCKNVMFAFPANFNVTQTFLQLSTESGSFQLAKFPHIFPTVINFHQGLSSGSNSLGKLSKDIPIFSVKLLFFSKKFKFSPCSYCNAVLQKLFNAQESQKFMAQDKFVYFNVKLAPF